MGKYQILRLLPSITTQHLKFFFAPHLALVSSPLSQFDAINQPIIWRFFAQCMGIKSAIITVRKQIKSRLLILSTSSKESPLIRQFATV